MKNLSRGLAAAALVLGLSLQLQAGNVLIINGASVTSESDTTSDITNNLQTLHIAAGNTVTIADAVPASLAGYGQVWDIRFSNSSPITAGQQTQYLNFLAAGGGMFVMGENDGFTTRNNSVLALIAAAGGGNLTFDGNVESQQTVMAPFTGPNLVTEVNYAAPGGVGVNNTGTGDFITKDANNRGSGLAFSVGDLVNAPAGALTVIFDVNFMQNVYDLPNSQNLTKNLIGFVGNQVEPPVNRVPDAGSTFAMMISSLLVLAYFRRK
ncbi:MAG: VPDSG-CTERM sorting domain-containing protein [Opitutaceae bacterium]|nr:VPDSG-CTERM sorting domain-containing protein [Opitutaceae bacterium]